MKKQFIVAMLIVVFSLFVVGCSSNTDTSGSDSNSDATDAKQTAISLLGQVKEKPIKASYRQVQNIGGVETTSTITSYRLNGKSRSDIVSDTRESRSYVEVDGTIISCNKPGAGQWACRRVAIEGLQKTVTLLDSPSLFNVVSDGETTQGSITASCYKINKADGTESSRMCISNDGILIQSERTDQRGIVQQTFLSVDGVPTENDFIPPVAFN